MVGVEVPVGVAVLLVLPVVEAVAVVVVVGVKVVVVVGVKVVVVHRLWKREKAVERLRYERAMRKVAQRVKWRERR